MTIGCGSRSSEFLLSATSEIAPSTCFLENLRLSIIAASLINDVELSSLSSILLAFFFSASVAPLPGRSFARKPSIIELLSAKLGMIPSAALMI